MKWRCERETTKGFVRSVLCMSRREWWRLVRAAIDDNSTVEDFICAAVRSRLNEMETPWVYPPASVDPRPGFVYLMSADGLTKIGRSVNPERRSKSSDVRAALLFKIKTPDMVWAEAYLHDVFESFQVHGEWYSLGRRQINSVLEHHRRVVENPPFSYPGGVR